MFKTSIPYTIDVSMKISEWNELVSPFKVQIVLIVLYSFEFIITIQRLSNVLCVTALISRIFQGLNNDVLYARSCIGDVIKNLEKKRSNFQLIFEEIV